MKPTILYSTIISIIILSAASFMVGVRSAPHPHPFGFDLIDPIDSELYGGGGYPYGANDAPYGYYRNPYGWPGAHRRQFYHHHRRETPFYFHRHGNAHFYPPIAVLAG